MYDCKLPMITADVEEELWYPDIVKLCKYWSVMLLGRWCSPGKKWYSTFDTTGSEPLLSSKYWLSVAQGWNGQLVLVELSGET